MCLLSFHSAVVVNWKLDYLKRTTRWEPTEMGRERGLKGRKWEAWTPSSPTNQRPESRAGYVSHL